MKELLDQLILYLKSTWRYRWYGIGCAWLIALTGWIVVDYLPDRYQARARVHLDTQSVLKPLLQGIAVQPNSDALMRMMSRTLINRPNIEKVVKTSGLEANVKTPSDRERIVSRLYKNVDIRGTGKDDFYTITYSAESPQEAKVVVEAFLKLFEEESIKDKRTDNESARQFIAEQLKVYGEKLMVAEKAVMEFKRENVGLLPGEGQGYYTQLRVAERELRQATEELSEAENLRNAIQLQLDRYRNMRARSGDEDAFRGINPELDARISALEKKLDTLRLQYTEQHPDVIAAERMVAQLKLARAQRAKRITTNPGAIGATDVGQQQLMVSLSTAESKVAAVRARVRERQRRYDELKAIAESIPAVEAKYVQLTRDYNVIKTRYNTLLERRESAQISGEMQQEPGVMGFRVVDAPRLPSTPTWPNRPRFITMVLLGALAGGLGLAFFIGELRPTFDNERKLREVTGLPVLGTVLMQWTNAQKARRRRGMVAFVISFAGLLSAYGAIMMPFILSVSRA